MMVTLFYYICEIKAKKKKISEKLKYTGLLFFLLLLFFYILLCYYCLHSEKTTLNVWIPGFCFNISSGISLLSIKSINAS